MKRLRVFGSPKNTVNVTSLFLYFSTPLSQIKIHILTWYFSVKTLTSISIINGQKYNLFSFVKFGDRIDYVTKRNGTLDLKRHNF